MTEINRQENYADWLLRQTPERQAASLKSLEVCIKLGEAQRKDPFSKEAEALLAEVKAYYEKWEGANDP